MKNLFLLLIAFISACSDVDKYKFNGVIEDPVFEGRKVYLVPLDNAIAENVDSTIVKDGKFSFSGYADSTACRIIRAKSFYPKIMQDLLVVPDKGTTNVVIGPVSSASGSGLNNKLQRWKEQKEKIDSLQSLVFNQSKAAGENKILLDSLHSINDSLSKQMKMNNLGIIKENINNGVGIFIFRIFFHSFTEEEKKEIISQSGDNLKNDPFIKNLIKDIN